MIAWSHSLFLILAVDASSAPSSSLSNSVENNSVLRKSAADSNYEGSNDRMPLALMILVPILSSGLVLVILTVVCIRRQTSTAASVTASPLVKTSVSAAAGSDHHHHQLAGSLQTLKRLSSLHHFYAKPWTASATYINAGTAPDRPPMEVMHEPQMDDEMDNWWVVLVAYIFYILVQTLY